MLTVHSTKLYSLATCGKIWLPSVFFFFHCLAYITLSCWFPIFLKFQVIKTRQVEKHLCFFFFLHCLKEGLFLFFPLVLNCEHPDTLCVVCGIKSYYQYRLPLPQIKFSYFCGLNFFFFFQCGLKISLGLEGKELEDESFCLESYFRLLTTCLSLEWLIESNRKAR